MITTRSITTNIIKIWRSQCSSWIRFQSTSTSSSSVKSQLDEYLTYYNTKKELRPYIYRPKNHNKLLTMSIPIKDDYGNIIDHATPEPKDPIRPISPKLLTEYIDSVEDKKELFKWIKKWTDVTPRKKDVWKLWKPKHLQKLLIKSLTELGEYSNVLGFIYSQKNKFVQAKNGQVFNVENFFNTVLLCTILRNNLIKSPNSTIALKKLKTAWSITQLKENKTGLSNILVQSLEQIQNFNVSNELNGFENKNLVLPNLSNLDLKHVASNRNKIIQDNELIYFISRALLERANLKQIVLPPDILTSLQEFIMNFRQLLPDKEDKYDKMMKSMNELYKSK
ncbi:mitochondrial 37S ribosomal protein mS44 MRP13 PWA37_002052 [Arxiozyma heterogenica]